MSFYKRGLKRASTGNNSEALEAYTAALQVDGVPEDVIAMALYNRALIFTASGEYAKAIADLKIVRAMPNAPPDVKLAAKRRLERIQHQKDIASSRESNPSDSFGMSSRGTNNS